MKEIIVNLLVLIHVSLKCIEDRRRKLIYHEQKQLYLIRNHFHIRIIFLWINSGKMKRMAL